MTLAPNSPVLVGAAAIQQRTADVADADDALTLVQRAVEAAAVDAGSTALLDSAEVVFIPQGTWMTANPASIVTPRSPTIRSVVAELGVLQQTILSRACSAVAGGDADVVIVCGGEAKYRSMRAAREGVVVEDPTTTGRPTERMSPAGEIVTREEIERGLHVPARQYALIDTALRKDQRLTPSQHIAELAGLWSRFSQVAETNPDAWTGEFIDPAAPASAGSAAMLAWPYSKLLCSQWNVDQAAALIICSVRAARRFGVENDRWVFAHVGIESNLMVPLTRRRDMGRSPAMRVATEALEAHGRVAPSDVEQLDVYSCFPAAVRVQTAELGLDSSRPLTVTGGMTFAGGPLNNYTLQALAKMAHVLRVRPTDRGLVTNVSGMLTKYGMSLWSCAPPRNGFVAVDVTEQALAATATVPFDASYVGDARVLSYTVAFDKGAAQQGIVIASTPTGARVLATTRDESLMASMTTDEWCDRVVRVDGADLVSEPTPQQDVTSPT